VVGGNQGLRPGVLSGLIVPNDVRVSSTRIDHPPGEGRGGKFLVSRFFSRLGSFRMTQWLGRAAVAVED